MVHVSVRDTDTDSCSVRSDVSVKSVNLYGSPIPENLDSWRNGFIILIRNAWTHADRTKVFGREKYPRS